MTPENIPKITISEFEAQKPIPLLPKPNVIYAAPLIATTTSYDQSNVKDKLKSVILGNSSDIKRDKINLPAILIATPLIATPANLILNDGGNNQNLRIKKEVRVEGESGSEKEGGKRKDVSKVERNRAAAKRYR